MKSYLKNELNYGQYKKGYQLENSEGKSLFMYKSMTEEVDVKGNVLIVPTQGMSIHTSFLMSSYLNHNGYNVYRFDGVNNVGYSDGTIYDYSVEQLEKDFTLVMDHILDELDFINVLTFHSTLLPILGKANNYSQIQNLISVMDISTDFGLCGKIEWDKVSNYVDTYKQHISIIVGEEDEGFNKHMDSIKSSINHIGQIYTIPDIGSNIGNSLIYILIVTEKIISILLERNEAVSIPNITDVLHAAELELEILNQFNKK